MVFEQSVLSSCIKDMKSIATTKTTREEMNGILFINGNLIASNSELCIKAKLEGATDEKFIIPAKAFDLINNLPDGKVEIIPIIEDRGTVDGKGNKINFFSIQLSIDSIKNTFQSFDPDTFTYQDKLDMENGTMSLDYFEFKEAISKVMYAVADVQSNAIMSSLYIECLDGYLNLVGLDGHRISWNRISYDTPLSLLIPKNVIRQLLVLDMSGNLNISFDRNSAIFSSEKYEVYARITDGKYYEYKKMFTDYEYKVDVKRKDLQDALMRSMLSSPNNVPSKIIFKENKMNVSSTDRISQFQEDIGVDDSNCSDTQIAFNPKLFIEALKSFDTDSVSLKFSKPQLPLLIGSNNVELHALILPVNLGNNR